MDSGCWPGGCPVCGSIDTAAGSNARLSGIGDTVCWGAVEAGWAPIAAAQPRTAKQVKKMLRIIMSLPSERTSLNPRQSRARCYHDRQVVRCAETSRETKDCREGEKKDGRLCGKHRIPQVLRRAARPFADLTYTEHPNPSGGPAEAQKVSL